MLKPVMAAKAAAGDKDAIDGANNDTQKERAFVIEAVLVRNMKARKTEQQTVLTNLVVGQTTMFAADPKLIKQRIEKLIERHYLKREDKDRKTLIYLP